MYVRKLKLSYFYNFKTFITSFYRSRKTNRRRHNQLTMFYLSAEGVFFLRPHHHPYHPDIWFSSQQKPKYRKSYPLWVLMYILSSTKMIVMTDNFTETERTWIFQKPLHSFWILSPRVQWLHFVLFLIIC